MSRKVFIITISLLLIFIATQGSAQDGKDTRNKQKLSHEVTVTANRLESLLKETAGSVTIITREDLEQKQQLTVMEALKELTGLHLIQNGPPGASASIHLRGANAEHTKILLDGIELNDPVTPSRSFNPAHLLVQHIERIEIIKGPQSTLYGSDALGGVINIISRKRQGPLQAAISSQGGSYGTFSAGAEFSGGSEKISYALGAAHMRSEGFSAAGNQYEGNTENDGYSNWSLFGNITGKLRNNLDLQLSFRTIRAESEIDNFGGNYGDDPNNRENTRALILRGGIRGMFFNNRWESDLKLSRTQNDRKYHNPIDALNPLSSDQSNYQSLLTNLDWQNNIYLHKNNTMTVGLEFRGESGESEYNSTGPWGPFQSIFPRQSSQNVAAYLQDLIRVQDRLFTTIGIRLDHHSRTGGAFTYRLAPAYVFPAAGLKLKTALGTGFKSPSLYQLFAPAGAFGQVGNPDLKPEYSTGWEAGLEQDLFDMRLNLGITYFQNRYRNLVDFDYLHGYINIGKAVTRGIEAYISAFLLKNLHMTAAYTRMESEDLETKTRLLRRPRDKFSVNLRADLSGKSRLTLNMIYIGERDDFDYSGWDPARVVLDNYILLNLTAAHQIHKSVRMFIRIDNLLNQDYEVIKGYGTPGFALYGGLTLNH